MMQLARRASLVVVLLLASVGTASAECAWVLWKEQSWLYMKQEGLPFALRATEIFTALRMPENLEAAQAVVKECQARARSARR